MQTEKKINPVGGESTMVSEYIIVLICGIIVLLVAIMNYREAVTISNVTYLMFVSAILILAAAALMYRQEKRA